MKKRTVLFFVVALLIAASPIFAAGGKEGQKAAPAQKIAVRLASAFDQKTSMLRGAAKFADLLRERSGGVLNVEIFAGGVMGGEKDNLEAVKLGELEMGVFGTYPVVTLTREYSFFDAPFIFKDKDHFYKVWEGKLGDEVRKVFRDQNNIRILGIMGRGYRHITTNKPVNSVDDLKGVKMRMGQSKPFIDAFTSIGAVVVPIALPELFTSLKMGVVESSEGPYDQIYTYKLQEVQKYIAITGHLYATSMWLFNNKFYEKLSPDHRAIIDKSAKEALLFGDQETAKDEVALMEKLKEAGVQFTKPNYEPFREKARPALERLFKESWPVTTWDELSK